jgi:hypothetical protein
VQVRRWHKHFAKDPNEGIRDLKRVRDQVDAAEKDLFRLFNEHAYVREEWDSTIHDDFRAWAPLIPALNNLLAGLERPEAFGPALKIEERWQNAENSVVTVIQWANATMEKIKQRRNALRNE